MTRPLKVYGTTLIIRGREYRTVVAASSYQAAAKAMGVPLSYLRNYCSPTGNENEISIAMTKPGTPFYETSRYSGEYKETTND